MLAELMPAHGTAAGYARPELLAEPDWLWKQRDNPQVRVIDCGGGGNQCTLEAYARAHIPGAVGLPIHNWIKEPPDRLSVLSSRAFAELMTQLGVSDDTTVIAYDHSCGAFAARLWWVLTYYGHADAKVLNGGWQRWVREGRPIRVASVQPGQPVSGTLAHAEANLKPGDFTPRPNEALLCRLAYLKAKLDDPHVQVLDLRSLGEWSGAANPFRNQRTGHLPGALHLEWLSFIATGDQCTFRPAAELRDIVQQAGVSAESEIVTYCQAGPRAAHGALVLSLLGFGRVRVYDGSMAEWANRDDTPLEVGVRPAP